ncbi:carotenoid biosynthesis protein [Halorubellus sp. PRR65]|uniref:carotenoid biosynthesis protein n=1 Tax=Halorubellus sp. PRR65 TaxID=3098148 RepID=UPI002B257E06|nr:carotenoid biosynthesis protein [Halorubellus sp. PRR65]
MVSPYASFEMLALVTASLCGVHAYRTADVPFFATSVVYGLVLEKLVVLGFEDYTYPAARFLDVAGIPVAIGLGWSVVLYAGYETARRWEIAPPTRAAFVALFVLHVDLALDAIAIRFQPVGFWTWTPAGEYFGVPLGNFFGWFAVGFLFVAVYDAALDRFGDVTWSAGVDAVRARAVAAVVTLVAASALIYAAMFAWDLVTLESTTRKAVVLGACITLAAVAVARTDAVLRRPAVLPSLAVLCTHLYFLGALLWLGVHRTEPLLLAMSLAMLAVAAGLHVLPAVVGADGAREDRASQSSDDAASRS